MTKASEKKKLILDDFVFEIALFLIPFENFVFAPSSGWAAVSPIIFFVYVLLNVKNIKFVFKDFKQLFLIFILGLVLSLLNYLTVGVHLNTAVDTMISIFLGFTSFFAFDIYYNKKHNLNRVIKILIISYSITMVIGLIEFLTIKFKVRFLSDLFGLIFKRNYMNAGRVQFFFTEPSFIGMHLYGILLPLYLVSKNKKILVLIILYAIEAILLNAGVKIIVDTMFIFGLFGLIYLIKKRQFVLFFLLPVLSIGLFTYVYQHNYRLRLIVNDGVYADGSFASRYFRINASIKGYIKEPFKMITGYGFGNEMMPLKKGYLLARKEYKNQYVKEINELGRSSYINESVSYCLIIRMISEMGIVLTLLFFVYMFKLLKNSDFNYKIILFIVFVYLYIQFESYAFYSLWLIILIYKHSIKTITKRQEIAYE